MSLLTEMSEALQKGKAKEVEEMAKKAMDEGIAGKQILNEGLMSGMAIIGGKF